MNMRPAHSRPFPEVTLGTFRVIRTPGEAAVLKRFPERLFRSKLRHRHLDINDRLGIQPDDGRRSDVVDPQRDLSQSMPQASGERREYQRPFRIVPHDAHRLITHSGISAGNLSFSLSAAAVARGRVDYYCSSCLLGGRVVSPGNGP